MLIAHIYVEFVSPFSKEYMNHIFNDSKLTNHSIFLDGEGD